MNRILYLALIATITLGCVKQEYTAQTLHPTTALVEIDATAFDSTDASGEIRQFVNGAYFEGGEILLKAGTYIFTTYNHTDELEEFSIESQESEILPLEELASSTISLPTISFSSQVVEVAEEQQEVIPAPTQAIYFSSEVIVVEADTEYTLVCPTPQKQTAALNITANISQGDPELITSSQALVAGLASSMTYSCTYQNGVLSSSSSLGGSSDFYLDLSLSEMTLCSALVSFGLNATDQQADFYLEFVGGNPVDSTTSFDISDQLATYIAPSDLSIELNSLFAPTDVEVEGNIDSWIPDDNVTDGMAN